MSERGSVEPVGDLVKRAADGDQRAWDALVERFSGLVWSVARAHRLSTPDAADVVQTCWLRLVEHLDRVREPERVGAWLATTARRESLKTLRRSARQIPSPADELDAPDERRPGPETLAIEADRDRLLWDSLQQIAERCQTLLRVLMASPPPSYEEVGAALGMPVGSIGPTRARCLDQLRRELGRSGLNGAGTGG